jgi:hypothetical protein
MVHREVVFGCAAGHSLTLVDDDFIPPEFPFEDFVQRTAVRACGARDVWGMPACELALAVIADRFVGAMRDLEVLAAYAKTRPRVWRLPTDHVLAEHANLEGRPK